MVVDASGYCTQCRTYRGPVAPQPYQPYSAAPVTAPYPPTSGPPGYPAYPPASAPPGGGRSPYVIPLIALCVALVIVAVGIVVVVVVKSNSHTQAQASTGPSVGPAQSAAIDSCLVGSWTVTKASQQFPVDGVGSVVITLQSGTQTVVIGADGTADDSYGNSRYEGTAGGHTYTLDVTGTVHYTIRTANDTITFIAPSASGTITATVDGLASTSIPLSVTSDPVHYTCSGNAATEHTDTFDVSLARQGT